MAIFYKLHYRENKKNPMGSGYYAIVANKGMVSTDEVADEIQRNCSMKRSDVLAVLAELSEVLKQQIQQSHSVKLNGIGVFRPGISSKMTPEAKNFTASCIKRLRLNFLPESTKHGNQRISNVFSGAKIMQETQDANIPEIPGGQTDPSEGEGGGL